MLEPNAFEMAMSTSPLCATISEAKKSGKDVPAAEKTRPIVTSDMPIIFAMCSKQLDNKHGTSGASGAKTQSAHHRPRTKAQRESLWRALDHDRDNRAQPAHRSGHRDHVVVHIALVPAPTRAQEGRKAAVSLQLRGFPHRTAAVGHVDSPAVDDREAEGDVQRERDQPEQSGQRPATRGRGERALESGQAGMVGVMLAAAESVVEIVDGALLRIGRREQAGPEPVGHGQREVAHPRYREVLCVAGVRAADLQQGLILPALDRAPQPPSVHRTSLKSGELRTRAGPKTGMLEGTMAERQRQADQYDIAGVA